MYICDVQRKGSVLDAGDARAQSVGQAHSVRDPACFRERRNYHPPRSAQAYWGALAKPTSDHRRRLTQPFRPPQIVAARHLPRPGAAAVIHSAGPPESSPPALRTTSSHRRCPYRRWRCPPPPARHHSFCRPPLSQSPETHLRCAGTRDLRVFLCACGLASAELQDYARCVRNYYLL
jgi:hypothetical protein